MFSLLKKITHLWSVQGTGIIQNVHCTVVEKGPHSSHLVWCYQIHHVYSKDMNRMPFRPTCILWFILPLFFIHVSPFLLSIFLVTIVLLHQCLSLETSHLKSFHLLELVTRYGIQFSSLRSGTFTKLNFSLCIVWPELLEDYRLLFDCFKVCADLFLISVLSINFILWYILKSIDFCKLNTKN